MPKLKSLKEFKSENSILEKKQLEHIYGGSSQTQYTETCVNAQEDTNFRSRSDIGGDWGPWGSWMYSSCSRHQILTGNC